jgi:hypothetical protein
MGDIKFSVFSVQFSGKAGSGAPRREWKLEEIFLRFESRRVFAPWDPAMDFCKIFIMFRGILFLL